MRQTLEYMMRYVTCWRDKTEHWWYARLMQEVGELGDTFTGETKDPRAHELRQIAAICLNWLDMRGEYEEEGKGW